jgi:hypothetical protein
MSTSTKTGGDTPIVISMDPATTFTTTIQVVTSTVEEKTSPEVLTQPAEVSKTTTESALLTSFDISLPNPTSSLMVVVLTTATTYADDEEKSAVLSSAYTSLRSTQTTIAPSSFNSASPTTAEFSTPSQPKPGLSIAASIGLGVSMGVGAFLVIVGVLYAVFGRYLRNMRRSSERRMGATNVNRWWKGRRRDS